MKSILRGLSSFLAVAALSVGLAAQTATAARYDADIQARAAQQLASKTQFHNLNASSRMGS